MEYLDDFKASTGSLYTMLIVSSYVWVGADDGSITAFEINPSVCFLLSFFYFIY